MRRLLLALLLLLALASPGSAQQRAGGLLTLLPSTTLTTAVADTTTVAFPTAGLTDLLVEAKFTYGSGGTTAKFWIQTRSSGGTWRDVMSLAFTTASATKWSKVSIATALAAARTASDAALADDTILDGFLGDEVRVKYTSTGTYAGGTTIVILGSAKY